MAAQQYIKSVKSDPELQCTDSVTDKLILMTCCLQKRPSFLIPHVHCSSLPLHQRFADPLEPQYIYFLSESTHNNVQRPPKACRVLSVDSPLPLRMRTPSVFLLLLADTRSITRSSGVHPRQKRADILAAHLLKRLKPPVTPLISHLIPPPQPHQQPSCHVLCLHGT